MLECFLMVIGALTLLAFATFGIAMFYTSYASHNLDPSAEQYATDSGLAIMSVHSDQELESVLLQRLSPEARADSTKDEAAEGAELLKKLGKLEDYKGVVKVDIQSGLLGLSGALGGKYTYTVFASFENGTCTLKISLILHDDGWLISYFHLNANFNPLLIPTHS
jgi:hypothetical protein